MSNLSRSQARLLDLLKLIHGKGELSRTDLIEQTKYSAFLVSKMCDELLEAGFIKETGLGSSTGGRPPTLLSINQNIGRVVGLHIGTVNARIAVTDLTGTSLAFRKVRSHVELGPDIALPRLASEVEEMLAQAGIRREEVRGIGVGISGVLDRSTGTTLFWPKVPQWVDVPVRRAFADKFETAVEVEDTPRTMALAERRFGAGGQASEFIYVAVGAGTGAALFLRDQLYTGAAGFAGEFGHVTVDPQGPVCSCGNRGCLEVSISASGLIQRTQVAVAHKLSVGLWRLTDGQTDKISLELIGQAAQQGDRFARTVLQEAGSFLGIGLVGMVNLLNPGLIIIGGSLVRAAGQLILPAVEQVIRERALEPQAAKVQIRASELDEVDWARGAALLVTDKALEVSFLDRSISRHPTSSNLRGGPEGGSSIHRD
jgi:predicted NBD/HSP70 family sugar kinase